MLCDIPESVALRDKLMIISQPSYNLSLKLLGIGDSMKGERRRQRERMSEY
jgi:hypothetical protein